MGTIGVPVKLLHESEGHLATVELTTGETCRGLVVVAEDNMNLQLSNVTMTARDGSASRLKHVYIRGNQIRFVILPDMLKNAPMFKRFDKKNADANRVIGLGRGAAKQ
jgi:small nuclear ribonucleoprotein D3